MAKTILRTIWLATLLISISAQECYDRFIGISQAELALTLDELTPREYILCPETTFKPPTVKEDGSFSRDDELPLVLRSRATVKCGDSGSSSNNCIVDGSGFAGIYIDGIGTSQELERRSITVQGLTFKDFIVETSIQSVVFFVASLGKFTMDDCIFDNVGSSAPFLFAQIFFDGNPVDSRERERALEAHDDANPGLDCDIRDGDCAKQMLINMKNRMESVIHFTHSEDANRSRELNSPSPNANVINIASTEHVENEKLRGLQGQNQADLNDGFDEGPLNIWFKNCIFKDTTMVELPNTNQAHTILYFTGLNYQTINAQGPVEPTPGGMNVRIWDTRFENIKSTLVDPIYPTRRSMVEFQSTGGLFLKNTCFNDIEIPSRDVQGIILIQARSRWTDQGGNSVSNILFQNGPDPNPDSGCPFITVYNLDLAEQQAYGFLQCVDASDYTLSDQCGEEPGNGGGNAPPVGGGFAICFSSENRAELATGEMKRFDQLQLGDEVLTQKGFESIYSFGHYNPKEQAEFIQLRPSRIELSSTHLVFLQDGRAVPAEVVEVGDILMSGEMVTGKRYVTRQGLYAPFTASGTIIANGQVASSFVSLQATPELVVKGWSTGISHQWMAHAFEVPHRLWCLMTTTMGGGGCLKESYTPEGISTWVSGPLKFFTWFVNAPVLIQVLLAVPILGTFGFLSTLDFMMTMMMDHNQAFVWMCFIFGAIVYVTPFQVGRKVKCQ
mmetsp:Transcript_27719/g.42204  ORF Transcript_27719/g.42204 Transcript_27719/m.42204 type:complete len:728 (-) Transcript_27719:46-2229(-)|eukprot:CAMPEP_0194235366 /NCGR_PEP_ID=MMETSP0158-20130606/2881_1 /TAXON_ID=33649 /ORGANISM="Thalassionema nitzschioides, Strain L26-B" /LENGTH=727 /DNA_ID=CAMNT_0038968831 /DNA_START=86 /DNA_END=2269 /DNA_ORIENTATION=+